MTNNDQPKDYKSSTSKNIMIVLALICFIIILYYFCFYISIQVFQLSTKDTISTINGLFGAISVGGLILTIILQSKELELQRKELKDNRAQLTRTADAQEGGNKFFEEQLRIANFPRLSFFIKYQTGYNFHEPVLISSFEITNSGKDCYNLYVQILHTDENQVSTIKTQKLDFLAEEETATCKLKKWEPKYMIKINYQDILGNHYHLILQSSYKKIDDINKRVFLKQFPTIPNQTKHAEVNEEWNEILSINEPSQDNDLFFLRKEIKLRTN